MTLPLSALHSALGVVHRRSCLFCKVGQGALKRTILVCHFDELIFGEDEGVFGEHKGLTTNHHSLTATESPVVLSPGSPVTVIRTELTISNSSLFTLPSCSGGPDTGFVVTRVTVRGRGNLAFNTSNIKHQHSLLTQRTNFSPCRLLRTRGPAGPALSALHTQLCRV